MTHRDDYDNAYCQIFKTHMSIICRVENGTRLPQKKGLQWRLPRADRTIDLVPRNCRPGQTSLSLSHLGILQTLKDTTTQIVTQSTTQCGLSINGKNSAASTTSAGKGVLADFISVR
jgi:hypothetical protein